MEMLRTILVSPQTKLRVNFGRTLDDQLDLAIQYEVDFSLEWCSQSSTTYSRLLRVVMGNSISFYRSKGGQENRRGAIRHNRGLPLSPLFFSRLVRRYSLRQAKPDRFLFGLRCGVDATNGSGDCWRCQYISVLDAFDAGPPPYKGHHQIAAPQPRRLLLSNDTGRTSLLRSLGVERPSLLYKVKAKRGKF